MRALWVSIFRWILLAGLIILAGTSAVDSEALRNVALGDQHLAAGEYGAALARYQEAIQRVPWQSEVSVRMGRAYLGRKEFSHALSHLYLAYDRIGDGRRAEIAAWIGQAWYQAGEWNEARRWWERTLAYDPYNRVARLGLAEIEDRAGNQGEAAYHLRMLLGRHQQDGEAAYRLGLLLLDLNREQAVRAFQQAIEAGETPWAERAARMISIMAESPADAGGAAQLGLVLLDLGELRAALRQFEQAVAWEPSYAAAHAYRGYVLAQLGRPASDAFRLALALDPRLVLGHYFLGHYHLKFGLSAPAREEFEAALALDADNPALGVDIALTYAEEGNYTAAEAWLEAALERAPSDPELALARARFYIQRNYKVSERGLPAVEHALVLSPQSAEARDLRGWAWYLLERYEEAAQELQQAVKLDPTRAAARVHYGAALLALGRREEAHWQLQRAIDLDPKGFYGDWAASLLR